MNSNDSNSLPPEIILEQYINEVKGITSRIEVAIYLLERQATFSKAGKQNRDNIEALVVALKRATERAEDYIKNDL